MAKRTQAEIDHAIRAVKRMMGRLRLNASSLLVAKETLAILEGKSDIDLDSDEATEQFGDIELADLQLTEAWLLGSDCDLPIEPEDLEATRLP